jgi:hypothetical protein
MDGPDLARLRLRKGNDEHDGPRYMRRHDHDRSPFRHLGLFISTEIAQEHGSWLRPKVDGHKNAVA